MQIDNSILDRAIEKWGTDAQVKMMHEECLECSLEIHKFHTRDGSEERLDKVIDEIADVTIMSRQMERIPGWKEKIQVRIDFKMKRLEERLNKSIF